MRSSRATISFSSVCAVKRRAAFCAAWCNCWTPKSPLSPAARSMTIRSGPSAAPAARKLPNTATTRPSPGCPATSASSRSSPLPMSLSPTLSAMSIPFVPRDVLLVFTANPEDYTARGKIITPLKDRIGAEIRTHYPSTLDEGMTITQQEAWVARDSGRKIEVPAYLREVVEEIAFQARDDKRVDRRSGVSQRLPITTLESVVSNAEQRATRVGEKNSFARVADIYAALPAITGKLELEYEGELKGADTIARELIRTAVGRVFSKHFPEVSFQPVIQWFELGGELKLPELASTAERCQQLSKIQGLLEHIARLGVNDRKDAGAVAGAAEMILEGLWAHRRIGRSEERGYFAEKPRQPEPRETPSRSPRRQYN